MHKTFNRAMVRILPVDRVGGGGDTPSNAESGKLCLLPIHISPPAAHRLKYSRSLYDFISAERKWQVCVWAGEILPHMQKPSFSAPVCNHLRRTLCSTAEFCCAPENKRGNTEPVAFRSRLSASLTDRKKGEKHLLCNPHVNF